MVLSRLRRLAKRYVPASLVRYRGPAASGKVALTFDDGPNKELTPRVLERLRQRGMAATFFVIGRHGAACPDLLRAMRDQGCEVGNHSWSHDPGFRRLSLRDLAGEIERADAFIRETVGQPPRHFRPPQGVLSLRLLWHLGRRRLLPAVLWSVSSSHEYLKSAAEIVSDLRRAAPVPGDIILLHDAHRATGEALPAILDLLAERGLRAVTLEELCGTTRPQGGIRCAAS